MEEKHKILTDIGKLLQIINNQENVNLTAIRNHFTFTKSVKKKKITSSIDPRARKDRDGVVFLYCSNCCGIDMTLSIKTKRSTQQLARIDERPVKESLLITQLMKT